MPTLSPYDLEPWMWRNLLARAAVFHATRTKLSELCDHIDKGGAVQGALLDLEMWAEEFAAYDDDDETTVTKVVAAWDEQLTARLGRSQLDTETRELLAELQALARLASWDDPFRETFARITALTRIIYGDGWRSATLDVAHIGRHPRAGHDPYPLTAVTPWDSSKPEAKVQLHIRCDKFGPAAFAALPMLLIHECICHVPACQDKADNQSTFAEGLMDWVAYHYHDRWAVKLDRGLAPSARLHAASLRQVLTRADSPEGRARRIGHQAAENLQAWFEAECGQHYQESPVTVALLAVQLNQVKRDLADKDRFVSLLGSAMPPDVERALHAWESGRIGGEELLATAVPETAKVVAAR